MSVNLNDLRGYWSAIDSQAARDVLLVISEFEIAREELKQIRGMHYITMKETLRRCRNLALEEAAKLADSEAWHGYAGTCHDISNGIRKLKVGE